MKRFAACLVLAIILAGVAAQEDVYLVKDRQFLRRQLFMYQLLWKPKDLQASFPDVVSKAANYKVEDLLTANVDQDAAQAYIKVYNNGILPRGRSASAFYPPHLAEIKALFDVLYTSKDFETFAVVSTWSRDVSNQILWFFGVVLATLTRHDTRRVRLPNVHEILPSYFYNLDVLMKFNKTQDDDQCGNSDNQIVAKYSKIVSRLDAFDSEALISYFTEDVGVENFYFYQSADVPFFMNCPEYDIDTYRRGERYFNDHKMFLARYNLERLSHGLGFIEDLDWNQNIQTGYYPYMADYNGIPFPHRPHNSPVPSFKQQFLTLVKQYQDRLITAADTGNLKGSNAPQGDEFFDHLMNAAQGNADSPDKDYYGSYDVTARHILGFNPEPTDPFHYIISALGNLHANVRDPAFYRIYKSIVNIGIRYKARLPSYTSEDIGFPGVKIDSVSVPSIKTYFDEFDAILGYQKCSSNDEKTSVIVRQKRLNHEKFNVGVKVNSKVSTKAVIRIFIGPKFDKNGAELSLDQSQHKYFELDQFLVNLEKGDNYITRRDFEFAFQRPDDLRSDEFYDLIKASLVNENAGLLVRQRPYGWPRRLIIPRGKRDGLTLRMFVIVNKFDEDRAVHTDSLIAGKGLLDSRSLGFPFDRPVDHLKFEGTNFAFKDIVIYHKH